MQSDPLWYWINERHAIWVRKHHALSIHGFHDPLYNAKYDLREPVSLLFPEGKLTDDPILSTYRFCNVFRELDRVTIWIREHINIPYADHPNLWLMLVIARTINWPPTLEALIGGPLNRSEREFPDAWPDSPNFSPQALGDALDALKPRGKLYTGAYMIRAESNPKAAWYSWTKQQYVAKIVVGRLWEDKEQWERWFAGSPISLSSTWWRFQQSRYIGWGPFMAFQVVLDLRHSRYLYPAPDASSWAAVGPGSMRGLNRLFGRDVYKKLTQSQALGEMEWLLEKSRNNLAPHVPRLEMEDIQNSLCETDKYLRVKLKEGEPRARYVPGRGW